MTCKCGRPAVYLRTFGGNATEPGQLLPYCPGCEYMDVAICDCVPERGRRRPASREGEQ